LPEAFTSNPDLKAAAEALERLYMSPEEEEIYEAQLKLLRDERGALNSAHSRGIERGIRRVLIRQLNCKFGVVPPEVCAAH
jgi:hypothetical protein